MNLQVRIDLMARLGGYLLSEEPEWKAAKTKAYQENPWFIPEFIDRAAENIANRFLSKQIMEQMCDHYQMSTLHKDSQKVKSVGIVMAGNIPLVGFHDMLCTFISGHRAIIKPSSKDTTLVKHLVDKLAEWKEETVNAIRIQEMLKSCDAYIATGSNSSSKYFEYYFGKYPHIIRRNRTSAAILDGNETKEELEKLADDVHLYFGLGCRNVTKIHLPRNYDFIPLLSVFKKYNFLADHHKYKNNYDYNLALHILNNQYYMTNGSIILYESSSLFSPISQLNYSYYDNNGEVLKELAGNEELQAIVGHGYTAFGQAQNPSISDYPDGADTMKFLVTL